MYLGCGVLRFKRPQKETKRFEQKVAKEAKIWVDNRRTKGCGGVVVSVAMEARQP